MCGIVGIIKKKPKAFQWADADLFSEMLICDSIRGKDSTGVFLVNEHGNAEFLKLATHPFNLLKSKEYDDFKTQIWKSAQVVVGHNRKATEGAIKNDNAHPFVSGPVILMHNGNISNFRSLLNYKLRDKLDVQVDSHAACVLFARNNPVEILEQMQGAFVFVWYDALKQELFFVRNEERPLAFIETENTIYFASEGGMLNWLVKRQVANVKQNVSYLNEGHLISVSIGEKYKWTDIPIKLHKPKSFETPGSDWVRGVGNVWHRKSEADSSTSATISEIEIARAIAKSRKNQVSVIEALPKNERFNIHYGGDEPVTLVNQKYLQIIWTITDYKEIPNTTNRFQAWGNALDSEKIECVTTLIGSEKQMEDLGYQPHLISFVRRISNKVLSVGEEHQEIVVTQTRPADLIPVKVDKYLLDDHFDYLKANGKCMCQAKCSDFDPEDFIFFIKGNDVKIQCSWCANLEVQVENNKDLSTKPSQPIS